MMTKNRVPAVLAISLCWAFIICQISSARQQGDLEDAYTAKEIRPSYNAALDPKLGTHVDLPQKDVFGRPLLAHRKGALIVMSGGCSECSIKQLPPKSIKAAKDLQIVLVYEAFPGDIPRHMQNLPSNFSILADADGGLAKALNATWQPRGYVVNRKRALVALQTIPSEQVSAFGMRVKI